MFKDFLARFISLTEGLECFKPGGPICTLFDLLALLQNLITFAYYLATVAFTASIVYGAFYIMLFGSSSTDLIKGRKIIINAAIGMALAVCAYIIVNTLFWLVGIRCPWFRLTGCNF